MCAIIAGMSTRAEEIRLEHAIREALTAAPGSSLGEITRETGGSDQAIKEALCRLLASEKVKTPSGQPRYWLWPSEGVRVLAGRAHDAARGPQHLGVTVAVGQTPSASSTMYPMVTVRFDEDGAEEELPAIGVEIVPQ
jgi:hypothetical protein